LVETSISGDNTTTQDLRQGDRLEHFAARAPFRRTQERNIGAGLQRDAHQFAP
jgi:hypothetical protein